VASTTFWKNSWDGKNCKALENSSPTISGLVKGIGTRFAASGSLDPGPVGLQKLDDCRNPRMRYSEVFLIISKYKRPATFYFATLGSLPGVGRSAPFGVSEKAGSAGWSQTHAGKLVGKAAPGRLCRPSSRPNARIRERGSGREAKLFFPVGQTLGSAREARAGKPVGQTFSPVSGSRQRENARIRERVPGMDSVARGLW
jgi:hypothetical protein